MSKIKDRRGAEGEVALVLMYLLLDLIVLRMDSHCTECTGHREPEIPRWCGRSHGIFSDVGWSVVVVVTFVVILVLITSSM